MRTVTSKDGATIAFDIYGSGPALLLVGGAFHTYPPANATEIRKEANTTNVIGWS